MPLGLAGFGGDFSGIRRFAERDHSNIVRWSMFERGGHFAAHKAPDELVGDVRAFAIKDHRDWPKDEDCGPGFGEIDHYRLFTPVMETGLTMPLVFENIFEPLVRRPDTPEGVDALARRAREYVESVIRGLQARPAGAA